MTGYIMGGRTIHATLLTDEEAANPRIYSGPGHYFEWWQKRQRVISEMKQTKGPDDVPMSVVMGVLNTETTFKQKLEEAGVSHDKFKLPSILSGKISEAHQESIMEAVTARRKVEEEEKKLRIKQLMYKQSRAYQRSEARKAELAQIRKEKGAMEEPTAKSEMTEQTEELAQMTANEKIETFKKKKKKSKKLETAS
eukprot:Selendium_serpulae@DN2667_c0_g1_i1.p1